MNKYGCHIANIVHTVSTRSGHMNPRFLHISAKTQPSARSNRHYAKLLVKHIYVSAYMYHVWGHWHQPYYTEVLHTDNICDKDADLDDNTCRLHKLHLIHRPNQIHQKKNKKKNKTNWTYTSLNTIYLVRIIIIVLFIICQQKTRSLNNNLKSVASFVLILCSTVNNQLGSKK